MNHNPNPKLRPNVAALIRNSDGLFLFCERRRPEGAWQLPQGGIDAGENPKEAVIREVQEETGIKSLTILKECQNWHDYYLPEDVAKKLSFIGQTQKYFLCETNHPEEINIPSEEFINFKWVNIDEILQNITIFKKSVYEAAFAELL